MGKGSSDEEDELAAASAVVPCANIRTSAAVATRRTMNRRALFIVIVGLGLAAAARESLHGAAKKGDPVPLKVAIEGYYSEEKDKRIVPDINGIKKGDTPLHLALCSKSKTADAAELLLQKGADPNKLNLLGDGPMHLLARDTSCNPAYLTIAKLLLKHGADPSAANEDQMTAMHLAANSGEIKLIRLLAGAGGDVNKKNAGGMTPLHVASRAMKAKTVYALLELGADPEIRDVAQERPRDLDEVRKGVDNFASDIRKHLERHIQIRRTYLGKQKEL